MSTHDRREFLRIIAASPLAGVLPEALRSPLPPAIERAARAAEQAGRSGVYRALFFTPQEWETVRVLAETIIPADPEGGGAIDAGVPEFIDFTLDDRPELQTPIRGGLRWLDGACGDRFGKPFASCTTQERATVLDLIAWEAASPPELTPGVAFFRQFRDLVASGYFTSRIGMEYLGYSGNTFVSEWNGCPAEALEKFGLAYDR